MSNANQSKATIVMPIKHCPECRGSHLAVEVKPIADPKLLAASRTGKHTHYFECPVTKNAVLAVRDRVPKA